MFRFLLKSVRLHFVLSTSAYFIQCINSHNFSYSSMGLKYHDNDTKQVINIFFIWPCTGTTSGKFSYERDLPCLMSRSTCRCLLFLLLPLCWPGKAAFRPSEPPSWVTGSSSQHRLLEFQSRLHTQGTALRATQ